MSPFLVIVVIVMSVMILIGSVYLLVYFQSEEDRNTAYAPKVAVVFGLFLTCLLVLMLPLDVGNRNVNGGFAMEVLWQVMYISVAAMCLGVVPFMMFYYEAWEPEGRNWQVWTAIKYEAVTIVVVGATLLIGWALGGNAYVPLDEFAYNATLLDAGAPSTCTASYCESAYVAASIKIGVTIAVYLIALVAFIGWLFFTVFVGVGLVALPMDLINDYAKRPQGIDLEEYAKQRMLLNERSKQLLEFAKKLGMDAHRKRDSTSVKKYNKFKQAVYLVEKDWRRVKVAYKERGGNPLKWCCQAVLGLLFAALSFAWYLHIILYVFVAPPPNIFLNALFIELDKAFSLFGTLAYGLFTFYLLACVLKGCMKVGLRFFWIPIHPMRIGGTLMNSFLFNVWLLLLCAVATVQFCFTAFQTTLPCEDATRRCMS